MFVGDKGWINVSRGSWDFSSDEIRLRAKDAMKIELNASKSHAGNFIDAIRGEAETVTNLESAIKSDIICHLSDIAIRSGKEVKWDANQETIVGDADQVAMMTRAMRPQYDLNIG